MDEPASVQIARMVCQLVVALAILGVSLILVLTHPEYNSAVALVIGVVMGSYFGQSLMHRHSH